MLHATGATRHPRQGSRVRADIRAVMATAEALGVSEYQLFERAWASHFGDTESGVSLPEAYAGYLFRAEIPDWVARHVLLNRAAVLGPDAHTRNKVRASHEPGAALAAAAIGGAVLAGILCKLALS